MMRVPAGMTREAKAPYPRIGDGRTSNGSAGEDAGAGAGVGAGAGAYADAGARVGEVVTREG